MNTEKNNAIMALLNTVESGEKLNGYNKEDLQVLRFLELVDDHKTSEDVAEPTPLRISTRSAKCKLTYKVNIETMAKIFAPMIEAKLHPNITGIDYKGTTIGIITKKKRKSTAVKPKFYNQATLIIQPGLNRRRVNIKFFLNGSISMTGCEYDKDGIDSMKIFVKEIKKHPSIFFEKEEQDAIDVVDYKITMINADYTVGFKIDRTKLFKLLKQNYGVYVDFDPLIYPGVKIGYMWNVNNALKDGVCQCDTKCRHKKEYRKRNVCKIVTVAIFQSGNIIITGAYDIKQTEEAYGFVNKILYDNYSSIVRFSIMDC